MKKRNSKTEAMHTEEAREAAIEARRRRSSKINVRTLKRRDREPGEFPTTRVAIQNFCRSCMGYEADDYSSLKARVQDCAAQHCWLWPYRVGALEE
jgi:hypothetical protein